MKLFFLFFPLHARRQSLFSVSTFLEIFHLWAFAPWPFSFCNNPHSCIYFSYLSSNPVIEAQRSNFSGKHSMIKIKQSKKSQSYHLSISLFPSGLKWTYRVGTRLFSFLAEREIAKLRFSLTLLYRGFLMNEAKDNQSDSIGSHSFGGRGNEWANLEVSSPHAAISIQSRRS